MAKRGAANYLTDQNWDQEEEEEEAGQFKQADKDTLSRRPIKKAVRRKTGDDDDETDGAGASTFKGFTGFTGFQKSTNPSAAFSSLGAKPLSTPTTNGSEMTKPSLPIITERSEPAAKKDSPQRPALITNGNGDTKSPSNLRSKYLSQLKSLNEGVSKWIKEHVDTNPYCILTPIFKDYETYLAELDKKYPPESREKEEEAEEKKKKEDTPVKVEEEKGESSPVKPSTFSFGGSKMAESGGFKMSASSATSASSASSSSSSATSVAPPVFSFGVKSSTTESALGTANPTSSSSGIFGSSSTTSSSSSYTGFKFGGQGSVFGSTTGTSGFSFGTAKNKDGETAGAATETGTTEEEYVPPKDEVTEIKEDDSLYSKRCKLFFKKDDQWKEKGVGNLHLKPCGEKTQLLVRADTNLGNILLNIMLNPNLPLNRQGKNNVALVCVPNPPIEGAEENAMTPMLIRVKTGDDADELFEKMKELKGEKS